MLIKTYLSGNKNFMMDPRPHPGINMFKVEAAVGEGACVTLLHREVGWVPKYLPKT